MADTQQAKEVEERIPPILTSVRVSLFTHKLNSLRCRLVKHSILSEVGLCVASLYNSQEISAVL